MIELVLSNQAIGLEYYRDFFKSAMQKVENIFMQINSFEDLERIFLKGQGLSSYSYKTYASAIRQFYNFTGGLNPLQVSPAWIEDFHDYVSKKNCRNTAAAYMTGLKSFFNQVEKQIPYFESPFKKMNERLIKKLNKTKSTKKGKALTVAEMNRLFTWLDKDKTILGLENIAIVRLLIGTGLRAFELCQLRWKDVEFDEDLNIYYCLGIGKGGKEFRQEIAFPAALEEVKAYFKAHFGRAPTPDDHLFLTMETNTKDVARPINSITLYHRIRTIGRRIKEAGIIQRAITWSPHLMRRTCGTILDKMKMSPVSIQRFLRHSSLATTSKFYICDTEPAGPYLQKAIE